MASYVVLTPPDDAYPDENTVLIRDGFAWLALILPLLWLLWHRLWFAALMLLLLTIAIAVAIDQFPTASLAFTAASLLVSVFVALEGNGWRIAKKERQGWTLRSVVEAENRATAEEIWFAGIENEARRATQAPAFTASKKTAIRPGTANSGPALGLMDYTDRG